MINSGRPRIEVAINTQAPIISGGLKGVAAIVAETERGEFGVSQLVRSWAEFEKYFGGLGENWSTPNATISPWLIMRMLALKTPLKITRVEHYTDIADKSTGTSVKATSSNSGLTHTAAQFGDFGMSITTSLAASGTKDYVDMAVSITRYSKLTKTYKDIPLIVSTALATLISATLEHCSVAAGTISMIDSVVTTGGYANGTAAAFGTFTWLTLVLTMDAASTISKAYSVSTFDVVLGGTYTFEHTVDSGSITGYSVELVTDNDGTETVVSNSIVLDATGEVQLKIEQSAVGAYLRISATAAAGALTLSAIALTLLKDSVTTVFSGGSYANASLTDSDFIGHADTATGIHAFDGDLDLYRIAIPHKAVPAIDLALAIYAATRGDLRAIVRTPVGLIAQGIIDYRNGTGVYSHTAIDTHYASMTTGGLSVRNPVTDAITEIPEVADIVGWKGFRDGKDNRDYRAWFNSAGSLYPIDALGVVYDLGTPARALDANDVSEAGVNSVINDSIYGVIPNDNRTLQTENTLLKHENISELAVYMVRTINILVAPFKSKPNDIENWKAIWRAVTPFLDTLVTQRAIREGYIYDGDQNIDTIDQAVVNDDPQVIDDGGYTAQIYFKPISALKYISIGLNLTETGVDLTLLAEQMNA